ncbi:uncharacterized protein LOC110420737 [Herrania umbratica]|uniref:Uncharacterized protein LOC110420737 n=1 Tax=Herrania umbratica TaxID=108875 RepID=A0A6J1AS38_9ROSI|nr:uncharacterized protein LOC110420737 [Herrania umbratica]
MGMLTHRINKESLKPGDHIYCWRIGFLYADHGIYVGDDKVIHLLRCCSEGRGSLLDLPLNVSMLAQSQQSCPSCTQTKRDGIISSCLNCFLGGRVLRRYEYGVNNALFIVKVCGGTCTRAVSDSADVVVHRAKYLLDYATNSYKLFMNNSEEFAIYCKTGVAVAGYGTPVLKGQAASIPSFLLAACMSAPLHLSKANGLCTAATLFGLYSSLRCILDIRRNRDEVKVIVEDLVGN